MDLSSLRSKIDDSLRQTSAYADVKLLIQNHAASTSRETGLSERDALEVLLSRSISVAAVTPPLVPPSTLDIATAFNPIPAFGSGVSSLRRQPGGLYLRVTLRGGRNFEGGLVDHDSGSVRWALRCSILFRGQRVIGEAIEVEPGERSPKLEGSFLFEVAGELELQGGLEGLASSRDLVSMCITKEVLGARGNRLGTHYPMDPLSSEQGATDATLSGLSRILIATAAVDWRQALTSRGGQLLAVSLRPAGDDQHMEGSSGLLIVGLDLVAATDDPGTTSARLLSQLRVDDDGTAAAAVASAVGRAASQEVQRTQEATRTLFLNARAWWNECARERHFAESSAVATAGDPTAEAAHPSTATTKAVKMFAVDETDRQRKFVCLFLSPLQAGRLLPSPRHALRFVSLLPVERRHTILGGGAVRAEAESWPSHFSLLSRRAGDAEAHALLLCSLLLGFGLNAYVALGTRTVATERASQQQQQQQHAWVVTFSPSPSHPSPATPAAAAVVGWDPVAGVREPYLSFVRRFKVDTCAVLFNACHLAAATQPSKPVLETSLDLSDARCWKLFPPAAIAATGSAYLPSPLQSTNSSSSSSNSRHAVAAAEALACLPRVNAGFTLLPPCVNAEGLLASACGSDGVIGVSEVHALEERIEFELRRRVAEWRASQAGRLRTQWDEELGYLLEPALAAYETERCLGVSFGNDDFSDSIRRVVPEGFQFKGYPACFGHADVGEMWRSLTAPAPTSPQQTSSVALDLLGSKGSEVYLAMRVKVVPYPDGMCATWVMLAVNLRP